MKFELVLKERRNKSALLGKLAALEAEISAAVGGVFAYDPDRDETNPTHNKERSGRLAQLVRQRLGDMLNRAFGRRG